MSHLPKSTGRTLGYIETRMALLHSHHAGTTQVTTVVHLSGDLSPARLHSGARSAFERFPLLRCLIRLRDSGLWFDFHDDFTRIESRVMARQDRDQWRSVAASELNRPIDQGRGLWRYVLLSNEAGTEHDLVLTRAHAISDGRSTVELLQHWLGACPEAAVRREQLPPAIDEGRVGAGGDAAGGAFLPEERSPLRLPLRTFPAAEAPPARCHWFELTGAQTAQVESRARELGVSTHSLISARFLRACREAGLGPRFELGAAVSLRGRRKDGGAGENERDDDGARFEGACGIAVTAVNGLDGRLAEPELARAYSQGLRAGISALPSARTPSDKRALRTQIRAIRGAAARSQLGITDLGRIDLGDLSPGLRVTGFRSSAARRSGFPALTLHAARQAANLSLALTWSGDSLPETAIQTIATRLMEPA